MSKFEVSFKRFVCAIILFHTDMSKFWTSKNSRSEKSNVSDTPMYVLPKFGIVRFPMSEKLNDVAPL